jgi:hypothetical protein
METLLETNLFPDLRWKLNPDELEALTNIGSLYAACTAHCTLMCKRRCVVCDDNQDENPFLDDIQSETETLAETDQIRDEK